MLAEGQASDQTPVFVVSTGRCGSTLLSEMLRLHPAVLSLSELFAVMMPDAFPSDPVSGDHFWKMLSRPNRFWTLVQRFEINFKETLYRPGPPARFTLGSGIPPLLLIPLPHITFEHEALFDELAEWVPRMPLGLIEDQYERLFTWLCWRLNKQIWIERSGNSLTWLDELLQRFPVARFVHMYRDGRDCAISMSRHNGFKFNYVGRQLFRRLGVDPFSRDDPPIKLPPPALRPFMPETFDRKRYDSLDIPVEDMGQEWSNMVVRGCKELDKLPAKRVTHLRYEALMAEPARELRRLVRFLGIAEEENWLREASTLIRPQAPRWTRLPSAQRRRLVEACAPGMNLLYGTATELVGPE